MRVLFYTALTVAAMLANESEALGLSRVNYGSPMDGMSEYPSEDIMSFMQVSKEKSKKSKKKDDKDVKKAKK